jgi:hypothetical protein
MKTILVVMKSLFKGVSSDFMNIFQFQSLLGQNELSKEVRVGGYFRYWFGGNLCPYKSLGWVPKK